MTAETSGSEFTFSPDNLAESDNRRTVDISVVGNLENTPEVNNELFGRHIASKFKEKVLEAQQSGKKLVFDMATGNSPKVVWPEIQAMIENGEFSLDNVIVIGHEEAWGNFKPGDKADFDAYRQKELFGRNNVETSPITEESQLLGDEVSGNFLPMRQSDDAAESVLAYRKLLKDLRNRKDVTFFGLYGVGTDGHIAEIQPHNQGMDDASTRMETYLIDVNDYSVERGGFQWKNDENEDFHPENNIFSDRKKMEEKNREVGRAQSAGYVGIEYAAGLGWRDMLREESMVIAYNGSSKKLAFELTMEGSFSGPILDKDGNKIMDVVANTGEGEAILPELEQYVANLIKDGILTEEEVKKIKSESNGMKCQPLFKSIYHAFDNLALDGNDPRYQEVWKLSNRYLGKRSPVAMLVKLRALAGKETELVVMPTDLEGTKFEELVKNNINGNNEANSFTESENANKSERKVGNSVRIRNFWGRLASEQNNGAETAEELGGEFEASKDGVKAYVSSGPGANETAESILEGYAQANPEVPVREILVSDSLTPNYPKAFLQLYEQMFVKSRNKLMEGRGLDPTKYNELDPEEQEEIAETAEAPVLASWLKNDARDNKLQALFKLDDASGQFAKIFNRHNDRIAGKLLNGSEVDLVHVSHRGIMEPFLTSGVLIRNRDGKRMTSLEELGGPMAILESWESTTQTDEKGETDISVDIRGEKYIIDRALLKEMVENWHQREQLGKDNLDKESAKRVLDWIGRDNNVIENHNISDERVADLLCDLNGAHDARMEHMERGLYGELEKKLRAPNIDGIVDELTKRVTKIDSYSLALIAEINPEVFEKIIDGASFYQNEKEKKMLLGEVAEKITGRISKLILFDRFPELVPETRSINAAKFWAENVNIDGIKISFPLITLRQDEVANSFKRKLLDIAYLSYDAYSVALDIILQRNPSLLSERDRKKMEALATQEVEKRKNNQEKNEKERHYKLKKSFVDINLPDKNFTDKYKSTWYTK